MKKNYTLGIFFMLLSSLGFAFLQMLVKFTKDVSLLDKLFFRNLLISIITYTIIRQKKISLKVPKSELFLLILRVFFGILGVTINFYTLMIMPLSDSSIIQKLSSFIMLILSYIFFKEKFTSKHFLILILSFFGVILIIKPGSNQFSYGYILSILGMLFASGAYCSIRAMGIRNIINPLLIIFYFSLGTNILLIPNFIFNFKIYSFENYLLLILIGIFGAIGQYGLTFAYRFAASKEISIFEYSQVILSFILGIVFFNEYPDFLSILGSFLIIFSAFILYNYNKKMNY